MPTLLDATDRDAILQRLHKLQPSAQPRWGKLTAPKMVCHLADALRVAKHDTLGPDAAAIASARALAARFDGTRKPIKTALLEQERVAGLGNIHAGEALFLARIAFFVGTSVIAYVYAWRKGVFRWD